MSPSACIIVHYILLLAITRVNYTEPATSHYFIPVAIKTTAVFRAEALEFFQDLVCHIREESREPQSHHYLIQWIAVVVQRGNTAAVMGTSFSRSFNPYFDNIHINHAWDLSKYIGVPIIIFFFLIVVFAL